MGIWAECYRCGQTEPRVAISRFLGKDYLCSDCAYDYVLELSNSQPRPRQRIGYSKEEQIMADMVNCRQAQVNFTHCNLCHRRFRCWTI